MCSPAAEYPEELERRLLILSHMARLPMQVCMTGYKSGGANT